MRWRLEGCIILLSNFKKGLKKKFLNICEQFFEIFEKIVVIFSGKLKKFFKKNSKEFFRYFEGILRIIFIHTNFEIIFRNFRKILICIEEMFKNTKENVKETEGIFKKNFGMF